MRSSRTAKPAATGSKQPLEAVSGPLKGTHLTPYPFLLTTLDEWHKQHPDTLVLKPLPGYADRLAAINKVINQRLPEPDRHPRAPLVTIIACARAR